jgi:hypothetical protein
MKIVGKRILLDYDDHNENYSAFLPRTGVIEKRLSSENVDNWFLLKLDEPFTYMGVHNKKLLIRSRWLETEIGDQDHVSVFIVQIPDTSVINGDKVTINHENHVAWGSVSL